jgi:hypothetical protein
MSNRHDVISAFLDNEPFEPGQLAEALSEPDGREVLIDLVALRHLVQAEGHDTRSSGAQHPRRSPLRAFLAAAAVLVALVASYLVGERRAERALFDAPPATRVVEGPSAWQVVPPGRMQ